MEHTLPSQRERMMLTELVIIEDMLTLFSHHSSDGLQWRLSRLDLMQMIHIVYESEQLRDDTDLPLTFNYLVRHYCDILHQPVPRNPSGYVHRALQCRGEKRQLLLLRYKKGQAYA